MAWTDPIDQTTGYVVTAADWNTIVDDMMFLRYSATNPQVGTTYTLVLDDGGKIVECNNAAAITLTVPPNSSVAFPVGTAITILQTGAGQITLTPGAAVTINSAGSALKVASQWGAVTLIKRATDTWVAMGNLTP